MTGAVFVYLTAPYDTVHKNKDLKAVQNDTRWSYDHFDSRNFVGQTVFCPRAPIRKQMGQIEKSFSSFPQGDVLAPLPSMFYTNDQRLSENTRSFI